MDFTLPIPLCRAKYFERPGNSRAPNTIGRANGTPTTKRLFRKWKWFIESVCFGNSPLFDCWLALISTYQWLIWFYVHLFPTFWLWIVEVRLYLRQLQVLHANTSLHLIRCTHLKIWNHLSVHMIIIVGGKEQMDISCFC